MHQSPLLGMRRGNAAFCEPGESRRPPVTAGGTGEGKAGRMKNVNLQGKAYVNLERCTVDEAHGTRVMVTRGHHRRTPEPRGTGGILTDHISPVGNTTTPMGPTPVVEGAGIANRKGG